MGMARENHAPVVLQMVMDLLAPVGPVTDGVTRPLAGMSQLLPGVSHSLTGVGRSLAPVEAAGTPPNFDEAPG